MLFHLVITEKPCQEVTGEAHLLLYSPQGSRVEMTVAANLVRFALEVSEGKWICRLVEPVNGPLYLFGVDDIFSVVPLSIENNISQ